MKPINRHPLIEDLIKLRRKNGMSQEQLSEIMGYARGNLSGYETGRIAPNMRFLTNWVQALDCELTLKPKAKDK